MTNKELFLLGMRHSIPVCIGYLSVGTAFGVMALQSGYSKFEAVLMSVLCYSGSGQIFAVAMAKEHAGLVAIAIGMFLLNFRYFIMSTCIFARFKALSNFARIIYAHFVTDEPFAIFSTAPKQYVSLFYLSGLVITSWLSWISGAIIGLVANDFLPYTLINAMNIALYALFIAIIIPPAKVNLRLMLIIVATAILNTVLTYRMDPCWSILISIVVCSLIGARYMPDAKDADSGKGDKSDKTELENSDGQKA